LAETDQLPDPREAPREINVFEQGLRAKPTRGVVGRSGAEETLISKK
jgi:hypothetical protein